MGNFNLKKFLVENKLTTNSKILNEVTYNNFRPEVYEYFQEDQIDENFFKSLMPKTAATMDEAMDRIAEFVGGTMFIHFQYFDVKPHGNSSDRPTYRIHNSQYWLNDSQLRLQRRNPDERVNVTLLTIYDISNPENKELLGQAYVDTKVYLAEQPVVFDILNRQS
jgi:hypothetical protein